MFRPLSSYSPMVIIGLCLLCMAFGVIQSIVCPVNPYNKSAGTTVQRTCQGVLGLAACAACLPATFMILAKIFAQ